LAIAELGYTGLTSFFLYQAFTNLLKNGTNLGGYVEKLIHDAFRIVTRKMQLADSSMN